MPELRDWYDRAAVSGRIRQPTFAELAGRGRRRARRTAAVRVTGVAVLAGLVGAPLLTLPAGNPPAGPAAPASATPEVAWGAYGGSLGFDDVHRGTFIYLRAFQEDKPETRDCTNLFSVTQDGGSTWSEPREVPGFPDEQQVEEAGRGCVEPHLTWIAPDTLVIPADPGIQTSYVAAGLEPPTASFISHDAGRTWEAYEPATRIADSVPVEVAPRVQCDRRVLAGEDDPADVTVECLETWVGWYDPQTGDRMVLRDSPPSAHGQATEAADGSIWVTGLAPSGEYHLSVSRDRGRSWLSRSPTRVEDTDQPSNAMLLTYDGITAYFYWSYWTPEADGPAPIHLYRTTDGGETWLRLPAGDRFEGVASMWVTRDGHLVVEDKAENHHLSRDNGVTFEPADLPVWNVWPVPGGYLAAHADHEEFWVDHALSEDGVTWQPVQDPPTPG